MCQFYRLSMPEIYTEMFLLDDVKLFRAIFYLVYTYFGGKIGKVNAIANVMQQVQDIQIAMYHDKRGE